MKKYKEIISYLIIIVTVVLIRTFILTPVIVSGDSMKPNLINHQLLILYKLDKNYQRFDILVINHDIFGKNENVVKRLIGLPGDYIEYKDSKLYVNNEYVEEPFIDVETKDFSLAKLGYLKIPEGYYFVVGDNRNDSSDSRLFGLVKEDEIKGKVKFSLFPFNRFGVVK